MSSSRDDEIKVALMQHGDWYSTGHKFSLKDLRGMNLSDHILMDADLSGADLEGADLSGCAMAGSSFEGACLRGAVLRYCDLDCANLKDADLRGADLRGSDLHRADLTGAKLPEPLCSVGDVVEEVECGLRYVFLREAVNYIELLGVDGMVLRAMWWAKYTSYQSLGKGPSVAEELQNGLG